jgi:hypothetical protein
MFKKLLIICMMFIASFSYSQSVWNYNRTIIGCATSFGGGMAWGLHEVIHYHYPKFQQRHPGADPNFWNPAVSWQNKWKNGDPLQGEAFPLSSTALVWTTDAKHILGIASNGSIVIATCVITRRDKRKWWEYGIDIVALGLARSAGFYLTYNIIYK